MGKFSPIVLNNYFNASKENPYPMVGDKPHWDELSTKRIARLSLKEISTPWIPFEVAMPEASKHLIVLPAVINSKKHGDTITVPIGKNANYVCIAHCCASSENDRLEPAVGEKLAQYTLSYADGDKHKIIIRRRYEIHLIADFTDGVSAFTAKMMGLAPLKRDPTNPPAWDWLSLIGLMWDKLSGVWIYAMPNPKPEKEIRELRMQALTEQGIAIFGVTLAHFSEHPLRLNPRNTFRLSLPKDLKVTQNHLKASLDMGYVTRLYPEPGLNEKQWLKDPLAGVGKQVTPEEPTQHFLFEATGPGAASFKVEAQDRKFELSYGEVLSKGESRSPEGAHIEFCYHNKTWVYVKVIDEETGKPIPTRARFLGTHGEYLPPYGHPYEVTPNWFEGEGGNVVLGGETFAYVPGEFQIELPIGNVFVELTKGFDYEPMRKKLTIEASTRQLTLGIRRFVKTREQNFVTADTHVHFLSPQTAWLEGQCEGLNVVNLLASQWGKVYTNVADITGKVSGCSEDDTIVFVGTENRHHMLGHMSMLGTKGLPVFPMCTGGPGPTESWLGDPDIRSQADWADECRAKGGVVIRPHFPIPNSEITADVILNKVDALEVRYFEIFRDTLDSYGIRQWYRYLNCGYRIPVVGGTDKMSAGMPIGGVRTYAKLAPQSEFSFDNWGKAIRSGNTFTTSGPIIGLKVEGQEVGSEIRLPAGGGTLEAEVWAVCAQPIHGLEIVNNGKIIAKTVSREGSRHLELKEKIKIDCSGWLAARCYSYHKTWHIWPINVAAHTSPIYIIVSNQEVFSPSDAICMLNLINGGIEWLDTLSTKADENTHRHIRATFELAERELHAKLGRMPGHHSH